MLVSIFFFKFVLKSSWYNHNLHIIMTDEPWNTWTFYQNDTCHSLATKMYVIFLAVKESAFSSRVWVTIRRNYIYINSFSCTFIDLALQSMCISWSFYLPNVWLLSELKRKRSPNSFWASFWKSSNKYSLKVKALSIFRKINLRYVHLTNGTLKIAAHLVVVAVRSPLK